MNRARARAAAAVAAVGLFVMTPGPRGVTGAAHYAQPDSAPLPDQQELFEATRNNLARATREQYRYAYKERRTELRTNPFGRLGTGDILLYDVTPGPTPNVIYRKLLERGGKPIADSRPERIERRERTGRRSSVEDAVNALQFAIDRREVIDGREVIVVRFEPRPDAAPQTREGRLATSFKGTVWVDEGAREVMRADATAIEDMSFGFGVIARLHKGTTATITRERVDDLWLPTSLRFHGEGRALLFRKLDINHVIEWFDYRRVITSSPSTAPPGAAADSSG